MRSRLLAGGGAVVLAAAVALTLMAGTNGGSSDDDPAAAKVVQETTTKPLVVPPSPREPELVKVLAAEPEPEDGSDLVLTVPEEINGWDDVPFTAAWTAPGGGNVQGVVDVQRVKSEKWKTVDEIEIGADGGSTNLDVRNSGIYRLAYGGSDDVEAVVSDDVTVVVDDLMPSRITATATAMDDDSAEVTAAWTTEAGVAITGDLKLQAQRDGKWKTVETMTTDADSTATVEVEAEIGTKFRFVYPGGSRFDAVKSDAAVVLGEDISTIGVSTCTTSTDIDNLAYGTACHYTPVESGTFVVAHDYLGNAWWNAMPMGTVLQLEGDQAGLYEVVDRVIAPGRGSALGPASDWTCGAGCDVILQTCQGANTGFTWLRRVGDGE